MTWVGIVTWGTAALETLYSESIKTLFHRPWIAAPVSQKEHINIWSWTMMILRHLTILFATLRRQALYALELPMIPTFHSTPCQPDGFTARVLWTAGRGLHHVKADSAIVLLTSRVGSDGGVHTHAYSRRNNLTTNLWLSKIA
ncbi:hypothetical protein BDZ88DRAFT_227460 [Geranomyces variabilis]|nr:hypothetical protein BDZ88DRAFT_227460 [Geranomyces variabilis]